jgi:hypothetical protein
MYFHKSYVLYIACSYLLTPIGRSKVTKQKKHIIGNEKCRFFLNLGLKYVVPSEIEVQGSEPNHTEGNHDLHCRIVMDRLKLEQGLLSGN